MKRLLEHLNIFAESDPTTAACTVAFVIGSIDGIPDGWSIVMRRVVLRSVA